MGLWTHGFQHPCTEHYQLFQGAQVSVFSGFEYLEGCKLHSLSGQPLPVLDLFILVIIWNFPAFQFLSVVFCSQWAPLRRIWLPLLHSLLSNVYKLWHQSLARPPKPSSAKWTVLPVSAPLAWKVLLSHKPPCGPVLNFLQYVHDSSTWKPRHAQ